MNWRNILTLIPEVKSPEQKRLSFKEKLKWTSIILFAFFVMSEITLFGLGENALSQFQFLSIILASNFGSLMSLGIGPIVTASIVLQLLKGSGLLTIDTTKPEGRIFFQGIQKLLVFFFVIFEAFIYVFMGGLSPSAALPPSAYLNMQFFLVFQLILGGILIVYMDEVISKWGFGSGVSLFIAAGVSSQLMIRGFSPLNQTGTWAFGSGQAPVGQVWVLLTSLIGRNPIGAGLALVSIIATIVVFAIAVYVQAMKIEIPLSFGRVRGHGIRWPLNFIYTGVIPIILVSALLANVQLWARLMEKWGHPWLGTFAGNTPATGLVYWLNSPNLVQNMITGAFSPVDIIIAIIYVAIMMGGATLFSVFWVQTAGMDASSQANQIMSSGLQIPGFRRDPRVLETILGRYIFPLTVMGGITIGLLSAGADLMSALVRGTAILLTVMIIYRLYEEIAQQHMMDMYPAMRKMMGQ